MAKTTVLLPEDLERIDAMIVSRSKLEHIAGMVEAASWVAPGPCSEMLGDMLKRLEKLMEGSHG